MISRNKQRSRESALFFLLPGPPLLAPLARQRGRLILGLSPHDGVREQPGRGSPHRVRSCCFSSPSYRRRSSRAFEARGTRGTRPGFCSSPRGTGSGTARTPSRCTQCIPWDRRTYCASGLHSGHRSTSPCCRPRMRMTTYTRARRSPCPCGTLLRQPGPVMKRDAYSLSYVSAFPKQ